ncbi:unnamed protein product, partial [marine sediment metagenome]
GKYTTWIDLLMGSKDNPVVIMSARYIGELCTVVAELVPTFSELKVASFEKRKVFHGKTRCKGKDH